MDIYTVSQLNRAVRDRLEQSFPLIWLVGEISNLSRPVSGHWYFSLKDSGAQVRCALFRNRAAALQARVDNGHQVLVRARVSLYEPRGEFQLIIEYLEEAGAGALRRAYDELRQRLEREGLFAAAHKRPIPVFPRRIGVITSPTGAAIRDVLSVLQRRFPSLPVLIYAVPVQGEGAGRQIAAAIDLASRRQDCDVLLLVRGGGSLEDLWAFNEEVVARAIHACTIPLVCGVGHETDVTIADFAADVRAPTPSAAAELVSPDRLTWLHKFAGMEERLVAAIQRRLAADRQRLHWLEQLLDRRHPGRRLQDRAQRLDELGQRLNHAVKMRLQHVQMQITALADRLHTQAPAGRIQRLQDHCVTIEVRLETAMRYRLKQTAQRLNAAGRALQTVSPLHTLGRGYAIVRRHPAGEVIRRADQVCSGEQIDVQLNEGELVCQVQAIKR